MSWIPVDDLKRRRFSSTTHMARWWTSLSVLHVIAVVIIISSSSSSSSATAATRTQFYHSCAEGLVLDRESLQNVSARSTTDCTIRCRQTDDCVAVNFCPPNDDVSEEETEGRRRRRGGACTMFSAHYSQACYGLVPFSEASFLSSTNSSRCRHLYQTDTVCVNGGSRVNGACACSLGFSGPFCQRLITDCNESYTNGHRGPFDDFIFIQPIGAILPFLVRCRLSSSRATMYVYFRTTPHSLTWPEARDGYGIRTHDRSSPFGRNFFIGLANLHVLTEQASYRLTQFMYTTDQDRKFAHYFDLLVGSESSGFRLSYGAFQAETDEVNGYAEAATSGGMTFSAQGHDPEGCAGDRGGAGWYGGASSCTGHSVFADVMLWRMGCCEVELEQVHWLVFRL